MTGPADAAAPTPARDQSETIIRWARIAVTVVLANIAWHAFHDEGGIGLGIMASIDLSVHEAGHMIFAPFGDTMHVLGGSLFECLLPAIFVAYFLRKSHRDVHAATVCATWLAVAMVDVSIYMADARARQLMLITGGNGDESDGHDWYHLFAKWHVLRLDTKIAAGVRFAALLLCVTSVAVGLLSAWQSGRVPITAGLGNGTGESGNA
jgi:hypothetical protein